MIFIHISTKLGLGAMNGDTMSTNTSRKSSIGSFSNLVKEERINISLMILTIPLSLALLGFLLKILLVIPTNNLDLLIFTRSEGNYDNAALILRYNEGFSSKLNFTYDIKIFCHLPSLGWFPCAIYWFLIPGRLIFSYGISNCHSKL